MAQFQFHHEKGPAGADYSTADDGASYSAPLANGRITYETAAKRHGLYGLKFANVGGANCLIRRLITPTRTLSFRFAFSADTLGTQVLQVKTAADANIIRIEYRSATGYIAITDVANTVFATSNNVADSGLNTMHEIAVNLVIDPTTATAGKINARRYDAAGNPVGIAVAVTNANLGTAQAQRIDYGNVNGGTARVVLADDLQWDDAQAIILPPLAEPPPPAVTNPRIPVGILGDSKAYQANTGEAAFDTAFGARGWAAAGVRTSGVTNRVPYGEDQTPSTQTSWNAWKAEGFDPKLLVLVLGGNIRQYSQNTWQTQFTQLFNMIDDGTRRIFAVNLAYKDPADGSAFNTWYAGWIAGRPNAELVDQYAMIRAREQAGQTVSWNADNVHMVPGATGYDLLNNLIATRVQTYVDGTTATAPSLATINAQSVAGGAAVTVTAVPTGTVTGYTWRQISGPTVTLTGSGASRSFTAPSQVAASTIVLGVTASNGTAQSSERQATINVAGTAPVEPEPQGPIQQILFDGVDGQSLTLANSGVTPATTGSPNRGVFAADAAMHGQTGALFEKVAGGNTAGSLARIAVDGPRALLQFGFYWKADATTPPAVKGIMNFRNSTTRLLSIARDANLGIYPLDRVNATGGGSLLANTAITAGRWYYLTGWVKVGTATTGEYHLRIYDTTTNALVASRDVTNADLGTDLISLVDVGTINDVNHITRVDTIRFSNQAAELAPYVYTTPAPTIANIAARTVEPFDTVTIVADVTGTVTSYTWRQVSGPAVTLTGSGASRSFRAPAAKNGATVVIGVIARNGTTPSTEKTASVQALPHLRWSLRAGVWIPVGPRQTIGAP